MLDELAREGRVVRIDPLSMRVLMRLVQHSGQLVSVQVLLDEAWGRVVVTPDSVYTAISDLRKVLGDDGDVPRYIANVPRRGYRLVASLLLAAIVATLLRKMNLVQ
jgi:DNA-binding winged helix-turn-helix (wHTH) protein